MLYSYTSYLILNKYVQVLRLRKTAIDLKIFVKDVDINYGDRSDNETTEAGVLSLWFPFFPT